MRLVGRMSTSQVRSRSTQFYKGDVLYARMRPYLNKVWVAEFDGLCSGEFIVFPQHGELDNNFLAKRLNAADFVAYANALVSGERPRVDFDKLSRFRILLPPLMEQRRIVAKLDVALAGIARGEAAASRAQVRLQSYRTAVLDSAIAGELTREWREARGEDQPTDALLQQVQVARRRLWEKEGPKRRLGTGKQELIPFSTDVRQASPSGWLGVRWKDVGSSQNGRAFPSREYAESGVKLLRPGNLYADGSVQWTAKNTRFVPLKREREHPDLIVRGNELIINLTAQSLKDEFLGRVCLTDEDEHCLLNQRLARLTPALGHPRYFLFVFKSPIFRRFVDGLNSGSLIQHMFTSQLAAFVLPFPPCEEQVEIVRRVDARLMAAAKLESKLHQQISQAATTRQSLLRDAFDGVLVPQIPTEEPASSSLSRIRFDSDQRKDDRPRTGQSPQRVQLDGAVDMQRTPSAAILDAAWQRIRKTADARRLFDEAGFLPEQVVQFYEMLKVNDELRTAFEKARPTESKRQKAIKSSDLEAQNTSGRFRLAELWLQDFRNLRDYKIRFDPMQGLDVVLAGTAQVNPICSRRLLLSFAICTSGPNETGGPTNP